MAITRDADFPAEIANLLQMFNKLSDGHSADAVLSASVNLAAAAIGYIAKDKHGTLADAEKYAAHVGESMLRIVRDNWARSPSPHDVDVKLS